MKKQEVENSEKASAEAKKSLDAARKGESVVIQAAADAEMASQYIELTNRLAELNKRIRNIEAAEQTLADRKKTRLSLFAPDRTTLKAVRKAIQARDNARLLMDASLISLEIIPEADGLLEVIIGEEIGQMTLSAGKATLVKGSPDIDIELKEMARIRASGPTGDVQTHRQTIREKEQEISEITRSFGTTDIIRLEELTEKAEGMERQVGDAHKKVEALLGDDDLETLKKDQAEITAKLSGIEKEHPGWKDSPPDIESLKRNAADLKRRHSQQITDVETAWERAHSASSAAREQYQVLLGRLDDVLTATDTGRLTRIMTILEESAETLQIIIMTCHPERYRALTKAEFFDMESLLKNKDDHYV